MHEISPSEKYLQWVLAERLANKAAADYLDRAVWPNASVPQQFPSKEVVAVLRERANECFKAAMNDFDLRAHEARRTAAAAEAKRSTASKL